MTYDEFIESIINNRGKWSNEVRYSTRGCERHHIVPRCLGGEPKNINWKHHENIIWLYPNEHFMAHKLLVDKYPDNIKVKRAFTMMLPRGNKNIRVDITPEDYEYLRKICSEINKGDNNPARRPEVRKKISENCNNAGENNPRYGVKLDDQLKQKISINTKIAMSKLSDEKRLKISTTRSEYNKKAHWWTDGVNEVYREICPEGYVSGRKKGLRKC